MREYRKEGVQEGGRDYRREYKREYRREGVQEEGGREYRRGCGPLDVSGAREPASRQAGWHLADAHADVPAPPATPHPARASTSW